MNRRAFIGLFSAAAAGLALDPERLLWVPGAKTFFLPTSAPYLASSMALKCGDIFTISGVFAVNPVTVIMSDVSAGDVALTHVYPQPRHEGPYRNVNHFGGKNTIQPMCVGKIIPTEFEWSERG